MRIIYILSIQNTTKKMIMHTAFTSNLVVGKHFDIHATFQQNFIYQGSFGRKTPPLMPKVLISCELFSRKEQ